ncbi:protein jagunal isoform X3 [Microplitis demolitor]|nr:protein jagunal isoform X3 [Microplitis demolitor]XP_008556093.1 protein jagunal isoform X3 [Microplitis demolitor]XP_014297846.1 protein jagunal isoform X3 [Microplitis demolitor]XP_014297847.1 protein jagunal isoform X3 [Microplitis demolitor]XP_053598170.1 protein jagunal isoform X3 [Microplitis demolitor]XP_053598171.1 protein jagunal isoform X3 [Microplitis demolitor]
MKNNIVWMDMEMTGLDIENDKILEIACLVTNEDLKIISTDFQIVIHQPDDVLNKMNSWCIRTHSASGLLDAVKSSKNTMQDAENKLMEFLRTYAVEKITPLAGNTIWMDRIFLRKYLPIVDEYLNYRIIDVSTIKELARAMNKSRLKKCILFHCMLFFVMLTKLLPDILDRLDIFILEVEELQMPKPLWWEYIWLSSVLVPFIGLSALKKNQIKSMTRFMYGIVILGFVPLIYAIVYYISDVWIYLTAGKTEDIQLWQDLPYGLLWYAFILAACQVHAFSLYFSSKLLLAWKSRGLRKFD